MTFSDLRKNFKPDSSDLEKAVFHSLKETESYFQDSKMSSLSVLLALSVCGKQTLMIASSNGAILTED
jgi:hypothetical protein